MITKQDREKLRAAAIGETVTMEDGSRKRVEVAKRLCEGCSFLDCAEGRAHCAISGFNICTPIGRKDAKFSIFVNAD